MTELQPGAPSSEHSTAVEVGRRDRVGRERWSVNAERRGEAVYCLDNDRSLGSVPGERFPSRPRAPIDRIRLWNDLVSYPRPLVRPGRRRHGSPPSQAPTCCRRAWTWCIQKWCRWAPGSPTWARQTRSTRSAWACPRGPPGADRPSRSSAPGQYVVDGRQRVVRVAEMTVPHRASSRIDAAPASSGSGFSMSIPDRSRVSMPPGQVDEPPGNRRGCARSRISPAPAEAARGSAGGAGFRRGAAGTSFEGGGPCGLNR